jgi:hypothetical protein
MATYDIAKGEFPPDNILRDGDTLVNSEHNISVTHKVIKPLERQECADKPTQPPLTRSDYPVN